MTAADHYPLTPAQAALPRRPAVSPGLAEGWC
jgi:hypothetical protein